MPRDSNTRVPGTWESATALSLRLCLKNIIGALISIENSLFPTSLSSAASIYPT